MVSVHNAILIASLPDISVPHFLAPTIVRAATETQKNLTIVLFSPQFNLHDQAVGQWDNIQRLLTFVYVQATKVAQESDKILLDVTVLLRRLEEGLDRIVYEDVEAVFRMEGDDILPSLLPNALLALPQTYCPRLNTPGGGTTSLQPTDGPPAYPVVALGGTFDHLHAGHKILLSMGAWIASEKLIVGVTDDALLKNKKYKEVLEDLPTRIQRVKAFSTAFKPSLVYDVVPIDDVYGPTGWDPNVQALVVSMETLSGAKSIADHRNKKSLPSLKTHIIDVISATSSKLDPEDAEMLRTAKMSSTYIREWIVQKQGY